MRLLRWLAVLGFVLLLPGLAWSQEWKLGVRIVGAAGGGVRILNVFTDSPADLVGLRPGNVILAIDGNLVNDPWLVRDYIMSGDRPRVTLIFTDGFGFFQVDAEFGVVATWAPGSGKVEKKLILKSPVTRRRVPDPRRR